MPESTDASAWSNARTGFLRRRAEPLTGVRQREVVRRPLDQMDAEALLELAQGARERRLGEVQPVGGPRDVALLRDREEGAQVAGLDGHTRQHNPVPTGISPGCGRGQAGRVAIDLPLSGPDAATAGGSGPADSGSGTRVGVAMVTAAIVSVQLGAAVARLIFDRVGPSGVVLLRLLIAAVVLLAFSRPRLRGRTRADWRVVIAFGVLMSMAA